MSERLKKPMFKKVDHTSLTVADLDRAIHFYVDVIGAELLYKMGPFDTKEMPTCEDGKDWTEAYINVPGARLEMATIHLPGGHKLELAQYSKPDDCRSLVPRNCDVGATHICLQTEDVDEAVKFLREHNCKVLTGPIEMLEGPGPASKSWYVVDPFGHQLELVQYI